MQILSKSIIFLTFCCLASFFVFIIKGWFFTPHTAISSGGASNTNVVQVAQVEPMNDVQKKGSSIFNQNCSSCHRINGMLVGPALAGLNEKYAGDEEWLYNWIRNAPKLINEGDEKAIALYEQYNQKQMSAFPTLTDEDINAILSYISYESS